MGDVTVAGSDVENGAGDYTVIGEHPQEEVGARNLPRMARARASLPQIH